MNNEELNQIEKEIVINLLSKELRISDIRSARYLTIKQLIEKIRGGVAV